MYFKGSKRQKICPKNGICAQNQYGRVIYRSGILHGARKNILLGVKKVKISLQKPKTEFGLQNQYDRETYPSIDLDNLN
jgi:sigma54-dependent transcription regulator